MTLLFHTYYNSPAGLLKISGTEHHINNIAFIADDPIAHSTTSNPLLDGCVEQLAEYFKGKRQKFTVPIYQPGTQFQQLVWDEVSKTNFGKTVSYMSLAKNLGDPKCIRAAASGNGKNNICIIVPCHRVVGTNQSLTGYAWGLPRKKWLLDHENKIANGVQTIF